VNLTAAEENVDRLADTLEEIVGRVLGFGLDAVELALDEEGTLAVEGAGEVAFALLLRAAGDFGAGLTEVKAGGAELLGHQTTPCSSRYFSRSRKCFAKRTSKQKK
jgi:hypothetical protein